MVGNRDLVFKSAFDALNRSVKKDICTVRYALQESVAPYKFAFSPPVEFENVTSN
jgi:hypothetical protein